MSSLTGRGDDDEDEDDGDDGDDGRRSRRGGDRGVPASRRARSRS